MKIALFPFLVSIFVLYHMISCCTSSSDNVNKDPCVKIADKAVEAAFTGQSDIADSLFNTAFDCDAQVAISSLSLLVDSILDSDDWDPAVIWASNLIRFAETANDTLGIATGYFYFGGAQSRSGKQAEALDAYEKAISLFRKFPPSEVFTRAIKSLGAVHLRLGNFEAARDAFWEVKSLRESNRNFGKLADVYNSIGNCFDEFGQHDSAKHWYVRGNYRAMMEKDTNGRAHALYSIGLGRKREGQLEAASYWLRNSFHVIKRTPKKEYALTAAINYADVLLQINRHDSAMYYANYVRGKIKTLKANLKTAELYIGYTKILNSLQDQSSWYRVDTALQLLDSMRVGLAIGAENRAGYYRKLFPFYNEVALWALNAQTAIPRNLLSRMSASSDEEFAFRLMESAKARTLLETLLSSARQETEGLKRDKETSQDCADSIASLLKLEAQAVSLEERELIVNVRKGIELKCSATDYLSILRSTGLQGTAAVQASLSSDDAILEYAFTDSVIILFVIKSDTTIIRIIDTVLGEQCAPKYVNALCDSLKNALQNIEAVQVIHSLGTRLSKLLLPLDLVRGQRRLIITPEQRLTRTPFECFRIGDAYAVDSFVISYAPSANVFIHLQKARLSAGAPLIIATPNLGGEFTQPAVSSLTVGSNFGTVIADTLRNVEVEVQIVDSLLGKRSTILSSNSLAPHSIMDALNGGPRVVHVSAHAFANEAQPSYSFLLLGRDTGNAPVQNPLFLLAAQIEQQRIATELVFLSACNTTGGRYVGGEGVFHLQRAFVAAGAKNVIATLWEVGETSALSLTRGFYSQWKFGSTFSKQNAYNNVSDISVAEALTQAKREMIKSTRFSHPSYWAPFVLMGS